MSRKYTNINELNFPSLLCTFCWWLVRVTLVVAFGLLPKNVGRWQWLMDGHSMKADSVVGIPYANFVWTFWTHRLQVCKNFGRSRLWDRLHPRATQETFTTFKYLYIEWTYLFWSDLRMERQKIVRFLWTLSAPRSTSSTALTVRYKRRWAKNLHKTHLKPS